MKVINILALPYLHELKQSYIHIWKTSNSHFILPPTYGKISCFLNLMHWSYTVGEAQVLHSFNFFSELYINFIEWTVLVKFQNFDID